MLCNRKTTRSSGANKFISLSYKRYLGDFPGGTVVESLPANAGDAGSSPGPGGSHMLRSGWAHAPQLLGLCSGAPEPRLLSQSATAAQVYVLEPTRGPLSLQLERARAQQQGPSAGVKKERKKEHLKKKKKDT